MEWTDVVAVGNDPRLKKRMGDIARLYEFNTAYFDEPVDLAAASKSRLSPQAKVTVFAISKKRDVNTIMGEIQIVRQVQRKGFLVIIISKKLPPDESAKLKSNGADLVFIENEAYYSSKLEYTISQKVKSLYVPIKPHELILGTEPNFKIFHVMPLNQKFLTVNYPGQKITPGKYQKMLEAGELYIGRLDLELFRSYVTKNYTKDKEGDLARCRGQFLALALSFTDLVLLILDESEARSFEAGKTLFDRCLMLTKSLLDHLDTSLHPWDIINHTSIGDFGAVVRSPCVAAYAGLMSRRCGIGDPLEVMIAALMSDIGMLELSPETTEKVQTLGEENLPSDYQAEYRLHPIKSLNACLSRRLPLPENVKNYIVATHERTDGTGYPSRLRAEKIPKEAQLIQFCELIDGATVIEMGKMRKPWTDSAGEVYRREKLQKNRFDPDLLDQLYSLFE